ncbi:MAG: NADH-quinone oxidoreductase subunit J [Candidatus Binatia bacterium]|jgi:NADH-quinone oxidoreductase subunit J|nr:NADH-quinone oxidoreductase subunit J [Candidatus Binatia bacterium]
MSLELATFFVLAALLLASSLMVVFQRNPVYSALFLVAALFIVALFFLALQAPMMAFLQIFVYAGAIMVIFLFVIMLLNPAATERKRLLWWGVGTGAAALFVLELALFFLPGQENGNPAGGPRLPVDFGSPKMLGESLFTDFVLPFEVASILLLIALIGAVILTKKEL